MLDSVQKEGNVSKGFWDPDFVFKDKIQENLLNYSQITS